MITICCQKYTVGWTSESHIIYGLRVADEEIDSSVRGHGTTCRLLYALDILEGYSKVVGTLRIDPVENDERAGEIRLFFSMAPDDQSRGVGGRPVRYWDMDLLLCAYSWQESNYWRGTKKFDSQRRVPNWSSITRTNSK
ncbi:hypothetical protein BJV82DRAFT_172479 [Fennellomyces sp. T-0311]|nr:hypothetical protein BJV82DRAFT_172479 [Fennellomyces sp. T-0311]